MKKLSLILIAALILSACNKDVKLSFETKHIEKTTAAKIAIDYPKAIGTKSVATKINQQIEHVIANEMNMADTPENDISVSEAVAQFDREFRSFKEDFQDSSQEWEVRVNGEVMYESAEIICISLLTYTDTGGAHGNSRTTYLNFNPETGTLLEQEDLIKNLDQFKIIAEKAFREQTKPKDNDEPMEDFFFGEDFQLPSNIGFSTNGLVLLYNNYEVASYAQGTTKINLPYDQIKDHLKVSL
ncbi:DUF3298 and DUF4163 domain-containing protein [Gelidibacter maritimus]|uniref:DUF3298 and DUF4163 domain-containing protein n=1 Tax=Gelidibacter maritimus TaxID=2761487 RepID=A0A7W2M3N8_9FLAO|nr:DUF3298 and DUF4163 domain-containing protein [Gelidibacter maritimus]MBA6152107.1 DUF3298 and DUF4163 domain-containing protein [Gelidibacter maritimus]